MYIGARAYSLGDIEFLAEADFAFAEIDWKDPLFLSTQFAELAALRSKYDIAYLAHGPNERNPFDVDEIAEVMGPTVCQLLSMAPDLGISLYTQHLWLDPRFVSAERITRKLDVLEVWIEEAERVGVTFCIENLSEHADHFAPAFQRLPRLSLTLDLGHGEILSRPNAAFAYIALFPDRIRHIHLHDNHGGTHVTDDLHLPIGQGRVDFPAILQGLQAAGYSGGFSFELKSKYVEQGRDAIREMWTTASLGNGN